MKHIKWWGWVVALAIPLLAAETKGQTASENASATQAQPATQAQSAPQKQSPAVPPPQTAAQRRSMGPEKPVSLAQPPREQQFDPSAASATTWSWLTFRIHKRPSVFRRTTCSTLKTSGFRLRLSAPCSIMTRRCVTHSRPRRQRKPRRQLLLRIPPLPRPLWCRMPRRT